MKQPFIPPDVSRPPFKLPARAHKYGAKATTVDGIRFASLAEARRYGELKLLERAGKIDDLSVQPEWGFWLKGVLMFKYLADFQYMEGTQRIVEDVKGVRTPVYRLKKKLIEAQHGIKITEIGGKP